MSVMMASRPFVLSGILVVSAVMAGCLGGEWPLEECTKTGDMYIETVSPPGYSWDTDPLVIGLGDEVTFKVYAGDCPVVDYEWILQDSRDSQEYHRSHQDFNASGTDIPGGFGTKSQVTKNDTMTFRFDHVGEMRVNVIFRDAEGRDMAYGYGPRAPDVVVFYETNEKLPTDGSTWSTKFRSICCPIEGATSLSIEEPGVLGQDWVQRFVVESTGEVLWEGRAGQYLGHGPEIFTQLGYDWNEVIRVELEPQAAFQEGHHQYRVDFWTGPWECTVGDDNFCRNPSTTG